MSFVYIDSQGREVNIPSVDAVRLRIELGAIKDQTRFFDSNTGKWAPAAEHEIYRTLKRQLMEVEQGFVAPPPPAVASDSPPQVAAEATEVDTPEAMEATEVDPTEATEAADGDQESGSEASGEHQVLEGFEDVDLLPVEEPEDDSADSAPGASGDLWESVVPDRERHEDPDAGPVAEAGPGEDDGEGDVEDGIHGVEDSFVTSVEDELLGGLDSDGPSSTLDDQSIELEPSLADSFSSNETVAGSEDFFGEPEVDEQGGDQAAADLETAWGQEQESTADTASEVDDAFDSVWDSPDDHRRPEPGAEADEASPDPDPFADGFGAEEESKSAPPPQRKLTRARTPGAERIVAMVALVVALGAAVFFGIRFLGPALGGTGTGESDMVMPALDPELFPRMRQLAGRASERMAQDMWALPERAAVPEEPSEDWLAGIYLAGASQYPNVPGYWSAVRDWVQVSQMSENALFREALKAQLDTANLAASDSEAIRDRALAGFQAAGSDRRVVYNQMLEVAERSIELHEFLLANEDQVTYEPAGSGVSRDPVLEAVPATEALGDEMWERVGSITNAMDALGYLNRIDTERLLGVFLEKLEATAIR